MSKVKLSEGESLCQGLQPVRVTLGDGFMSVYSCVSLLLSRDNVAIQFSLVFALAAREGFGGQSLVPSLKGLSPGSPSSPFEPGFPASVYQPNLGTAWRCTRRHPQTLSWNLWHGSQHSVASQISPVIPNVCLRLRATGEDRGEPWPWASLLRLLLAGSKLLAEWAFRTWWHLFSHHIGLA